MQPSSGFAPAVAASVVNPRVELPDGEQGPGRGHLDIPMALHDNKAERFVVARGVLALSHVPS